MQGAYEVVTEMLTHVTYKEELKVVLLPTVIPSGCLIQIQAWLPDNADLGINSFQAGRKWFIEDGTNKGDILRTIFLMYMSWEEHETRELLQYKGKDFFSPHWDVD